MDEEESDTEDSFELEITPQQINQVTPGGGVLKLTLSRKKPLKITAGAPSGELDPSQTTIKTVYDPREEKWDQPTRGTTNIAQSELRQPRGGGTPPIGGREPPHEGENGRPDRPPRRRGGPNDGGSNGNGNGSPIEMVIQMAMVIRMGVGIQIGMEDHPGEGKSLLERNGELGGGDGGSDPSDDDGDGSSFPSSNTTPPRRRRHKEAQICLCNTRTSRTTRSGETTWDKLEEMGKLHN